MKKYCSFSRNLSSPEFLTRECLGAVEGAEKHQFRRQGRFQTDLGEQPQNNLNGLLAGSGDRVGDIDIPGALQLQVGFDGHDQISQFHRFRVNEMIGLAAEFLPVVEHMVNQIRDLSGVAVGVHGAFFGQ